MGAQMLGRWNGGPSGAELGHIAWEAASGHIVLEAALAQSRQDGSPSCFADRRDTMLRQELALTKPW